MGHRRGHVGGDAGQIDPVNGIIRPSGNRESAPLTLLQAAHVVEVIVRYEDRVQVSRRDAEKVHVAQQGGGVLPPHVATYVEEDSRAVGDDQVGDPCFRDGTFVARVILHQGKDGEAGDSSQSLQLPGPRAFPLAIGLSPIAQERGGGERPGHPR